jgi:hypothetical protein
VAQTILQFESLIKISRLLDQFMSGLCKIGVLPLIQQFPQLFLPLFTYTGNVQTEDVLSTLYVDEDDTKDDVLFTLLCKYIEYLSTEGKFASLSVIVSWSGLLLCKCAVSCHTFSCFRPHILHESLIDPLIKDTLRATY